MHDVCVNIIGSDLCYAFIITNIEPAVIVLHSDEQSLIEAVAGHARTNTSLKLSLVCAAYGEPDYPYIKWSSPTIGVEDYSNLTSNNTNVITEYLSNTAVTISILELCDIHPGNLMAVYECDAVNSVERNLTSSQTALGNSSVMFSFVNETVEVVLLTKEVIQHCFYRL